MPEATNDYLKTVLQNAGISKTVYAYRMPETRAVLDGVLAEGGRADLHAMFDEAWTQKQDLQHEEFFATWLGWSRPIVEMDHAQFPFMYPTAGSSEGIRSKILLYGASARAEGFEPTIHIFSSEYEGYKSTADAAKIPVKVHSRVHWPEALDRIGPKDLFFLSHPSAIDGNVWEDYDEFITALHERQPTARVMLDLTYVGAVARPFRVKADYPNVDTIFFSLSKPCGVYYDRIGGCLTRKEDPVLFGNKWFKNLMSLTFGTALMKAHGVYDLPQKYAPVQQRAIRMAGDRLGLDLSLSDVFLLATAKPSGRPSDIERYLTRGHGPDALVRVCLTPTIAAIVNPTTDATVRPRYHETLAPGV